MSARKWQPGDVAMLRCGDTDCGVTEHPGILGKTGAWWLLDLGEYAMSKDVEPWRPLVVIDPEDREQVERLVSLFFDERTKVDRDAIVGGTTDAMQAALREFADPKPPKPEEPTDPSVRVRALETEWARVGMWWVSPLLGERPRVWDALIEADDFEFHGYDPEATS